MANSPGGHPGGVLAVVLIDLVTEAEERRFPCPAEQDLDLGGVSAGVQEDLIQLEPAVHRRLEPGTPGSVMEDLGRGQAPLEQVSRLAGEFLWRQPLGGRRWMRRAVIDPGTLAQPAAAAAGLVFGLGGRDGYSRRACCW